jgi:CRISPR system Cascade subunit CasA
MFLVQLAALALHHAGLVHTPESEVDWRNLLRGLTLPEFPGDEPWCLCVTDRSKPAFLQAPVPMGVEVDVPVPAPDALDILITANNHEVKKEVAKKSCTDDWIFALVSLQTGASYHGRNLKRNEGNYGIARMRKPRSRAMVSLAPLGADNDFDLSLRPGRWFKRDVEILLTTRDQEFVRYAGTLGYMKENGIGLTWLPDWPVDEQLPFSSLDIWFVEVCRRIRLKLDDKDRLVAERGYSRKSRIAADHRRGVVGDPWAPVSKAGDCAFDLEGEGFTYEVLYELLISGDWEMPLLAKPAASEPTCDRLALIAEAIAKDAHKDKSLGFKSRILPIRGTIAQLLTVEAERDSFRKVGVQLHLHIQQVSSALRDSLATVTAGGNWEAADERKRERCLKRVAPVVEQFSSNVDSIFFEHLWESYEAHDSQSYKSADAIRRFRQNLVQIAKAILMEALPGLPCNPLLRPSAEAQAWILFKKTLSDHASDGSFESHPSAFDGSKNGSRINEIIWCLTERVLKLAPGPLADLRRMNPDGPGCPTFWWLAAEAGLPDIPQRAASWRQIVRILAILTPKGERSPTVQLQNREHRLGEVLCNGGDPLWLINAGKNPRPFYSQMRLARLMSTPADGRGDALEGAARMLARNRNPDVGFQCRDFVDLLLNPTAVGPIQDLARFYYSLLQSAIDIANHKGNHP